MNMIMKLGFSASLQAHNSSNPTSSCRITPSTMSTIMSVQSLLHSASFLTNYIVISSVAGFKEPWLLLLLYFVGHSLFNLAWFSCISNLGCGWLVVGSWTSISFLSHMTESQLTAMLWKVRMFTFYGFLYGSQSCSFAKIDFNSLMSTDSVDTF